MLKRYFLFVFLPLFVLNGNMRANAADWQVGDQVPHTANAFTLVAPSKSADIVVDPKDYPAVKLAATLLQGDVKRVTGKEPALLDHLAKGPDIVLVGTLGNSALIDQMAGSGLLGSLASIHGKWEVTSYQIVDKPFPGISHAFVIVGSDRRGSAYGLMTLSERSGVSPWYWWADVPVEHRSTLTITQIGTSISRPT